MNVFDSHMYNWHSRTVIIIADISSLFSFGSFLGGHCRLYVHYTPFVSFTGVHGLGEFAVEEAA
jgi:hypothetical protein